MTKQHQHRATDQQWARQRQYSADGDSGSSCILELRDRIQALELALRIQAGLLTGSEQTSLGVAPVSVLRGAVQHGADLAITEALAGLSDKTKPAASLVNINDDVSVRLTDYGRSVIPHIELQYMKTDASGWTNIQLYHLMRIFGPHIWSGPNVFEENEILVYS